MRLQPAVQEATTETNRSASMGMAGAAKSQQQDVHVDPANSQVGRQHQQSQISVEASLRPGQQNTEEQQRVMRDTMHSPVGSAPSMCGVDQAKLTHSAWSFSESTSSSDTGLSETCSRSPAVGDFWASSALLPVGTSGPIGHPDGVTLFTVCSGSARDGTEPEIRCGVAADMTPAFDLEQFVMDHISENVLQHHRLTDYVVELLDDGPSHANLERQCIHCGTASQQQQRARSHTAQQSILLLIAAVLEPRAPSGSVKCAVLAVSLNMPSGIKRCHAPMSCHD